MPTVYELWRKPMWMNCPMETFVLINNLQLHCPIGVMEQEQVIGNDFCINLRIGYDFTRAMTSDDVDDTLNYAAVYQRTREVLGRLDRKGSGQCGPGPTGGMARDHIHRSPYHQAQPAHGG